MREVAFVLGHYAAFAALGLVAYVLGRGLVARLVLSCPAERASICVGLGLGVLAYVTLALGLAGALRASMLIPAVLVLLVGSGVVFTRTQRPVRRRRLSARRAVRGGLLALALVLALAPLAALPLFPPTMWDATSFHLAVAKIHAARHVVEPTPYLRFPVAPQLNELLFADALLLYDDVAAQLVVFLMMMTVAVALYGWGRAEASPRAGLWAATLWLGTPLVARIGSVPYVDVGLTLFATLAVWSLLHWISRADDRYLALGAAFGGFAAGAKQSGTVVVIALSLAMLVLGWRSGRWKAGALGALGTAAVAMPWYAYSWWYTGDPLFPVLGRLFGYTFWSAQDLALQAREMRSYGSSFSWTSLLSIGWANPLDARMFHGEAPFSAPLVVLFPVTMIGSLRVRSLRPLAWVVGAAVLVWFNTIQILRYLMPVMPLLCLLTAVVLDRIAGTLVPLRAARAQFVSTVLVAMILLAPSWVWAYEIVARQWPLPVTPAQRSAYLRTHLPSYPAYQLLNRLRGSDYRLYQLFDEQMAYFADGTFMGDWFGIARYGRVMDLFGDGAALRRELAALGADHFLLKRGRPPGEPPLDSRFWQDTRVLYDNRDVLLLELVDQDGTQR